jgi:radical SAM protein (TIGR01212 family)
VDGGFSCPNRDGARGTGGCLYCNERSFTGGILFPGLPVEEQVERTIASSERRDGVKRFLVYFQRGSGTYGDPAEIEGKYRAALRHPRVVGLVVGTRPDCLGPAVLEVIGRIAAETYVMVELGLQSASDEVLRGINRGHTVREFLEAAVALRRAGAEVGAHLIYGLPGDAREGFVGAAGLLSGAGVRGVKLHHLHVVRGSGLERAWREGLVRVPEYDEYVSACADFLARLSPGVAVMRLAGSAPPGMLLAPRWEKGGAEAGRDVAALLKERGLRQGSLYGPAGQS